MAKNPTRPAQRPASPRAPEATPDTMLVRLKPYDPKRGSVLRTLMTPDGKKYEVDKGWYEVGYGIAESLKKYRQDTNDPSHPIAAFDVCTHDEANEMDERAARTERASAQNPVRVHSVQGRAGARTVRTGTGDMTTSDMRGAAKKTEADVDALLDALDDPDLDGSEPGWDKVATAPTDPAPAAAPRAARAGTRRSTTSEA